MRMRHGQGSDSNSHVLSFSDHNGGLEMNVNVNEQLLVTRLGEQMFDVRK